MIINFLKKVLKSKNYTFIFIYYNLVKHKNYNIERKKKTKDQQKKNMNT